MLTAVSFGTVVMGESLKTFCVLSNYCIIRISHSGNQKEKITFSSFSEKCSFKSSHAVA